MTNDNASEIEHVEIDKGVPIPFRAMGKAMYPWHTMEVGDSFLHKKKGHSVAAHAWEKGKRLGRKFVTRTTAEGVRVWRIE